MPTSSEIDQGDRYEISWSALSTCVVDSNTKISQEWRTSNLLFRKVMRAVSARAGDGSETTQVSRVGLRPPQAALDLSHREACSQY